MGLLSFLVALPVAAVIKASEKIDEMNAEYEQHKKDYPVRTEQDIINWHEREIHGILNNDFYKLSDWTKTRLNYGLSRVEELKTLINPFKRERALRELRDVVDNFYLHQEGNLNKHKETKS